MGLSNYVPNSRLAQPGVCTSTTRPASPFEGQVIYETDTNRVLVYDASAWVMIADTDEPPGLQLIKTQTLSGTTTQVDNCFVSNFDSYKVVFSNATSSTIDFITLRLVDGTTPDQSNNYYGSRFEVNLSGTTAAAASNGVSYWIPQVVLGTTAAGGTIEIQNPQLAAATSFQGSGTDPRTTGAPLRIAGGYFNGTTQFEGLWISTLNGTYTLGGTVRVYGYRN